VTCTTMKHRTHLTPPLDADMTNFAPPGTTSLTGLWQGQYSYPIPLAPTDFVATLLEAPGWISGSTTEVANLGPRSGRTLYATLQGQRQGSQVAFVKTYEGDHRDYGVVHYAGTLSGDGTEIEGTWRTQGWSGKFLMIRTGGRTEAATKKAFEPA
jgi:hypothetical protein